MKKLIIILSLITLVLSLNKEENLEIPKDSIRFRVIASSNSKLDQQLKRKVVTNLTKGINNIEKAQTIEESRQIINKELPNFETIIKETLQDNNYQINYGKNYFPKKQYQKKEYPAGEYESVVVTIGKGEGDNFWCVLFPPLCFNDEEPKEYKSFIKEFITKYF